MLLVWMLFHAGIEGAQADTAGGNLPSPGTIALLQPEDEECIALGKLLQQSKLEQFYSKADTMLDNIDTLKGEDLRLSELKRLFWVFYHVASAPTFHLDYDEHTENTFDESMDYEVKLNIQYDMENSPAARNRFPPGTLLTRKARLRCWPNIPPPSSWRFARTITRI